MLVQTQTLSPAERILIDRRRRGETQAQAARRMRLSKNAFRDLEIGEAKPDRPVSVGRLTDYEQCLILRRRHGLTMQEVADDAGISRWSVVQIEGGSASAARLVEYWS